MEQLNRDQFFRDGHLIVRNAVPQHRLEQVRAAYETLVNRQRDIWHEQRQPASRQEACGKRGHSRA